MRNESLLQATRHLSESRWE